MAKWKIPYPHDRDWGKTELCLKCGLDMSTKETIDNVCYIKEEEIYSVGIG